MEDTPTETYQSLQQSICILLLVLPQPSIAQLPTAIPNEGTWASHNPGHPIIPGHPHAAPRELSQPEKDLHT